MPYLDLTKERESGLVLESYESDQGTFVEMIQCPTLGVTCFMNGLIQSAEMDEKQYHVALTHRVMISTKQRKNVLILGGGEGAVAREVLLDESVQHVDMYDWDTEVVEMFRERYPRWGKKAWSDERLHLYHTDVFETAKNGFATEKYNVIIVDLFDVTKEDMDRYKGLIRSLSGYLEEGGTIVMYIGIHSEEATKEWVEWCLEDKSVLPSHSRYPYAKFIPSFEGNAAFMAWLPRE
jgi:spermidine synthase